MLLYAGIYVFHPTIPGYPKARFPGVVVFSEIYQGTSTSQHSIYKPQYSGATT